MKISIIMPIYNGQRHLKRAIHSVLNQTYEKIELILINDGSEDASLSICKKYKKQDGRIVLIDIENSGAGFARNKGLKKAMGDYICFVDADDWLRKDALEILLKRASKKDYDIIAGNHFRVDKVITVSKNNNSKSYKTSSSFGYVWGKLYKTDFIRGNKIKFSQEGKVFLEDTLFNLKAISYNPKYYVLNKPLYYYNIYEDSVSNKKEEVTHRAIRMLEDYEMFLDKNNKYHGNLDLFVPLVTRVIAWSLMKSMENRFSFKNLCNQVLIFSQNVTVRRVLFEKSSFRQLRKTGSIPQLLLYSFIIIGVRYELEMMVAGFFYMNYPLFKIYIKHSLKN